MGIALAVVDVHIKVKIRKVDLYLVDIALGILMNDLAMDSGTEECLIIEDHLFLKIIMGDGWYRTHSF